MSENGSMDELESIRQVFFEECGEHLSALENELETFNSSSEKINTIFRAVHSIKGGAGAFGMENLVRAAHLFETVLEKIRSGQCSIDQDKIAIFLKATDSLADIVAFYRLGTPLQNQDNVWRDLSVCLEDNSALCAQPELNPTILEDIDGIHFQPVKIDIDVPVENTFYIEVQPLFSLYSHGDDVRNLFEFLQKKGFLSVELEPHKIPLLDAFEPDVTYLQWNITLKTSEARKNIEEIFEWSGEDLKAGFVDFFHKENTQEKAANPFVEDESLEGSSVVSPVIFPTSKAEYKENSTVRVDTRRVDKLVDLVSELVINQGAIRTQMQSHGIQPGSPLDAVIAELNQLTHELQENVMAMRAHPIRTVFQRMGRIVRETARLSGKQVLLHIEGEETEIDRSILEKLFDPLMHMVRNAIDHGLENADVRSMEGKTYEGNLYLRAFHHSGRVIIEVEDDGSGLDCKKIYNKAVENKVIFPGIPMEKEEIQNLIFSPGFSTVEIVSDLSGRGVGMDVVKNSISDIGGKIIISSKEREGTKFSISLPLTLSVLEGLIFKINNQKFIIPVPNVVEAFVFNRKRTFKISEKKWGYSYRDEIIPIDVSEENEILDKIKKETICIVVEDEKKSKIAIMADEIIDQSRFVIKSIEKNYKKISGFSLSSILGDGSVALIVDVDSITNC